MVIMVRWELLRKEGGVIVIIGDMAWGGLLKQGTHNVTL